MDYASDVERYEVVKNIEVQDKKTSLFESVVNVAVGYGVSLASQLIIFPIFNIHITLSENIQIGIWFTVISIIRSFAIRRYFNWRSKKDICQRINSR